MFGVNCLKAFLSEGTWENHSSPPSLIHRRRLRRHQKFYNFSSKIRPVLQRASLGVRRGIPKGARRNEYENTFFWNIRNDVYTETA